MKKFLACDVDGTLLPSGDAISPKDCAAIRRFREAGNHFALCTGRTLNWVRPLFADFPLEADSLILANGATLYNVDSLNPLQVKKLSSNAVPAALGKEIISYLYNNEDVVMYWGDGDITYELEDRRIEDCGTFNVGSEATTKYVSYKDFMKNPTDILGFGTAPRSQKPEDGHAIRARLEERWGKELSIISNLFFVDVMLKDISKGNGIKQMLEIIKTPFQTYGIGDSFNDEPMFHFVGKDHAFLMAEGDSELHACTHKRVESVAECIDLLMTEPTYA